MTYGGNGQVFSNWAQVMNQSSLTHASLFLLNFIRADASEANHACQSCLSPAPCLPCSCLTPVSAGQYFFPSPYVVTDVHVVPHVLVINMLDLWMYFKFDSWPCYCVLFF